MNTAEPSHIPARARDYLNLCMQFVSEGLGRMANARVTAELLSSKEFSPLVKTEPETGVWFRFFAGKAGEQAFSLDAGDARRLAHWLRGEPSAESSEPGPDPQEAVGEFFQQIAAMIPVASWVGFNAELEAAGSEPPAWESAAQAEFRLSTPEGPLLALGVQLSTDFVAALEAEKEKEKLNKKNFAAVPPPVQETAGDLHLELLKDVELEVTLRFGQREMFLKDVLNLTPGTVVELDQQIHDPVELLAGSKVIAWGEVVAVDGNYGLRITRLPSREERLESLRK